MTSIQKHSTQRNLALNTPNPCEKYGLAIEELEPRLLYSADFALPGTELLLQQNEEQAQLRIEASRSEQGGQLADAGSFADNDILILHESRNQHAVDAVLGHIVVLDTQVQDYGALFDEFQKLYPDQSFEIFTVTADQNGFDVISDILSDRANIASLHIFSHASTAELTLGNATLNSANLDQYQQTISQWSPAFTDTADLLIYGCDLAANGEGQKLINTLAAWSAIDVAASSDLTGHAQLGGDWQLEYKVGDIDSLPQLPEKLNTWQGTLAVLNQSGEIQVNTSVSGNQETGGELQHHKDAVAMDAAGNYVVVWSDDASDGSGYGVFGQRYNSAGVKVGAEFQINQTTADNQYWASVGMAADGRFTVVWTSEETSGGDHDVYARQYDMDGTPDPAGEFVVNTTTAGSQEDASIAMAADGRFVVVWEGAGNGYGNSVFFRRFNADGSARDGSEIKANQGIAGNQRNASVAINSSGEFIIAWAEPTGGVDTTIYFRKFNDAGIGLASETDWDHTGALVLAVDVAINDSGKVAIAYAQDKDGAGSTAVPGVYYRLYDSSGAFESNNSIWSYSISQANNPAIYLDNDGNALATFEEYYLNSFGVSWALFNAAGDRIGGTSIVNETTSGDQINSSIAAFDINNFVVAWSGEGAVDADGVFVRNYGFDRVVTVDTVSDVNDGDVSSMSNLIANKGADGKISLREAIIAANNSVNGLMPDEIRFDISGNGPHTINLTSALPAINDAVFIHGASEPDYDDAPVIEINGAAAGDVAGIYLGMNSEGSTIQGLSIVGFNGAANGAGIVIDDSWSNALAGNYIGIKSDGVTAEGNRLGIELINSALSNTIGGSGIGEGNVISANQTGISMNGVNVIMNSVLGNRIGTSADGSASLGNSTYGILLGGDSHSNAIGGVDANEGNLIKGNAQGVAIVGAATINNPVRGNQIYDNDPAIAGTDFYLQSSTITANDNLDADTGANNLQNHPVLTSTNLTAGTLDVAGTLNSAANTSYLIDLYATSSADVSNHGPAQQYLGNIAVTTDAAGNALFSISLPGAAVSGSDLITATATVDLGSGNFGDTSGFSENAAVVLHNTAPHNYIPATQNTDKNHSLIFSSANGNAISVGDYEAVTDQIQVTLTATNGTATITGAGGPPQTVSGSPAIVQSEAVFARSDDGSMIAVWASDSMDGDGWGIYAQRFDAAGQPQGGEFLVNTTTVNDQFAPAVAVDNSGNFVITWTSNGQDGSATGIYAQRFNQAGAALGGEFLVNTHTADSQSAVDIAMTATGEFVIVWQSANQDGSQSGIYGQRFNASGVTQGSEFLINSSTAGEQYQPAIAIADDGGFVVVWADGQIDGSGAGIVAQRFDAAGIAVGSEFVVNSNITANQDAPAVATDAAGNFVVVWQSDAQDSDGLGIFAQRFNSSGAASGGEFQVNTHTLDDQARPDIAMAASGEFTIVWESLSQDGDGWGIFARDFDNAGSALGPEKQVNTDNTGEQSGARIAMNSQGDYSVIWSGQSTFDDAGITVRHYLISSGITYITGDGYDDSLITLKGTVVDINNALDGLTFNPSDDFVGTASLQIATSDLGNSGVGGTLSTASQVNISVIDTLTPQIDLDADDSAGASAGDYQTTFYNWLGTASLADVDALIIDADSSHLQNLKIRITNPVDGGLESFTVDTSGTGITANFASNGAALLLSGTDTVANYQQVLRTVNYTNSATNPDTSTRIIEITASDGNTGNTATTSLAMVTNTAPVIHSNGGGTTASISIDENQTVVTNVTANDADLDTLNYSISGGADATLFNIDAASGALSFALVPDYEAPTDANGDRIYEVQVSVSDGKGGSDLQDITVIVSNINEAHSGAVQISNIAPLRSLPLTASHTLLDPDGISSVSYQWLRNGVDISGAQGSSYIPGSADVGAALSVRATVTDGSGASYTVTSAASGLVAEPYILDNFSTSDFTGNQGTVQWSGAWQEANEADGPSAGSLQVSNFLGRDALELSRGGANIARTVDLSAASSASLTVDLARGSMAGIDRVDLQISNNGGATWYLLDIYTGPAADSAFWRQSYDISAYISNNTSIRFDAAGISSGQGTFYVDQLWVDFNFANTAPIADASASTLAISEGESVLLDASHSSDADGDALSYSWDLNNDGDFRDHIGVAATLDWVALQNLGIADDGSYTIGLKVDDGNTGYATTNVTLVVNDTAPLLTAAGNATVTAGESYLLNLSALDPGVDTISNWTVDWGDGNVEVISGDPSTVSHQYSAAGLYDIQISATDEDGTHLAASVPAQQVTVIENIVATANDDSYSVVEDQTLTVADTWFDTNWAYRKEITIDNSAQAETLLDMPLLVKLDATTIDYSQTQNSAEDLRFVDHSGNVLAHVVESWDESGTSYVWVRMPQINASSSDSIWLYYGNSAAASVDAGTAVWNGDYEAVYHLNNDFADATGNTQTGTNNGTINVAGHIGDGQYFNGNDNVITVPAAAGINNIFAGGGSVSAWINPASWGEYGNGRIFDKSATVNGGPGWTLSLDSTTQSLVFEFGFDGQSGRWVADSTIQLNTWQQVAVVYDSSSSANIPTFYIDGVEQTLLTTSAAGSQSPIGSAQSDVSQDLAIGNHALDTARSFAGSIDAAQLSSIAHSPDWVAAQYLSHKAQWISIGNQQAQPTMSGVLSNDRDFEGNAISAILGTGPSHAAAFSLNSDGTFSYMPVANFHGSDSFTYFANDGSGNSAAAAVTIVTTAVNDAPSSLSLSNQAVDEWVDTSAGFSIGRLSSSDVDAGDSASYSIAGGADQARFSVGGALQDELLLDHGVLDFESQSSYAVVIRVTDSAGASHDETFTIQVNDRNDAPEVGTGGEVATTAEDTQVQVTFNTLLAATGASDVDGDVVGFLVQAVENGTLSIGVDALSAQPWVAGTNDTIDQNHHAFWTPAANQNGVFTAFSIAALDDQGRESVDHAEVDISVTAVNDTPTAISLSNHTLNETTDTSSGWTVGQLQASDVDVGDSASFSIAGGADQARFSIGGALQDELLLDHGVLDFESQSSYAVVIRVTDAAGASHDETFTIQVNDLNDAPEVGTGGEVATTAEDTEVQVTFNTLLAATGASDVDGNVVGFLVQAVENGTLSIGVDALSAQPWVAGTNDTIDQNHHVFWTPAANQNGVFTAFSIAAVDDQGRESVDHAEVDVSVTAVNDAPTAISLSNHTLNENIDTSSGLAVGHLQAYDVDVGDNANFSIAGGADQANFSIGGVSQDELLLDAGVLDFETQASYAVEIRVTDSAGAFHDQAVVIQVNDLNDAPEIGSVGELTTTTEDTQVQVTFDNLLSSSGASDTDGMVTAFVVQAVENGSLWIGADAASAQSWSATGNNTIDSTRHAFWTPGADMNGTLSAFSVAAVDDQGAESIAHATVGVTVTPVNDAVSGALSISGTAVEDQTLYVDVSGIQDRDGLGAFQFQWLRDDVEIPGATTHRYSLGDEDVGAKISVIARFTDNHGGNEVVISHVNSPISNINDQPELIENTSVVVTESGQIVLDQAKLQASDVDNNNEDLIYTITQAPAQGHLYLDGVKTSSFTQSDIDNGRVSYRQSGSWASSDSFQFNVDDGMNDGLISDTSASFQITILDAPDLTSNTITYEAGAESLVISEQQLSVLDHDSSPDQITYTLTEVPKNGQLQLSGKTLQVGDSFTQADVKNGRVSYVVDSTKEAVLGDGFAFTLGDTQGNLQHHSVNITIAARRAAEEAPATPETIAALAVEEEVVEAVQETPAEDMRKQVLAAIDSADKLSDAEEVRQQYAIRQAKLAAENDDTRAELTEKTIVHYVDTGETQVVSRSTFTFLIEAYQDRITHQIETLYATSYENLFESLKRLREEISQSSDATRTVMGSALVTSAGLSAGYVIWMLRGGMLLSSMMFSMPAWMITDPLPILNSQTDIDDDDESLESIIEQQQGSEVEGDKDL